MPTTTPSTISPTLRGLRKFFSSSNVFFIVFYLTALLTTAVGLRISSSRLFYKFNKAVIKQNRLRQQLWQKQLEMEGLISPYAVSERTE